MKTIFQTLLFRLVLRKQQSFGGVFARVLQADTLQRSADEMANRCSPETEKYAHHSQRQGYATHS
jgi:hypothetical protein